MPETHRTLVLSDLHIPYHDRHAWDLTLAIVGYVKPDHVCLAGDVIDAYMLSLFDRDPNRYADGGLQEELDQWRRMARMLRSETGDAGRMTFLPGNHEDRLRRYIWRHPELHGIRALELPMLMDLESYGIEYHEYEISLLPSLIVRHGRIVRKHSGMSAKAELEHEKYAVSTITGHTHRLGSHYARTRRGVVKAMENGCLCDLEPEYVRHPDWHHGCTLVTHWGKDAFHADEVPYLGEGKRIKAMVLGNEVRP
jgi:predicted phosphodiesterase